MKTIFNLTQHKATAEQVALGVVDLPEPTRSDILRLMTFDDVPSKSTIVTNSQVIAEIVSKLIHRTADVESLGSAEKLAYELDKMHATPKNLNRYYHPQVMIGGALFLMPHLERELKALHIQPLYAFTKRESVEKTLPDGSVEKVAVFHHAGWVQA